MKMIKNIFIVLMFLSLVSCSNSGALDFNDKLVGIQKSLMSEVNKIQSDTLEETARLVKVQDITRKKIGEINDLKTPSGGEAFKKAMIDDFNGIISSYDVVINMMKATGNDNELKKLQDEFSVWQKKIEELDENVITEQKKFATKNNIRLERK